MFTQEFSVCFSSLALLKNKEKGVVSCLRNKDKEIIRFIALIFLKRNELLNLQENV
ncbi:hypothetical protein Ple7327_3544 [Pleurocapsa sp. PCC 7327]|nr:hypothetical protein Ple7327_3544 [Pleurocapsa sp. PCC 7327]